MTARNHKRRHIGFSRRLESWWRATTTVTHGSLVTAGLIALVLLAAVCNLVFVRMAGLSQAYVAGRIGANQTVNVDGVELAFGPARYDTVGAPGATPTEGSVFLIKRVVLTNHTGKTVSFLPSIQVYMRDDQGVTYPMRMMVLKDPIVAGDIASGETRTGELGFEVPTRPLLLSVYLEPSWTARGALTFEP